MNSDVRSLGVAIGLICLLISPVGFIVLNYVYFFKPEQHGLNPERYVIILNILCVTCFWGGWKLFKKCSKHGN